MTASDFLWWLYMLAPLVYGGIGLGLGAYLIWDEPGWTVDWRLKAVALMTVGWPVVLVAWLVLATLYAIWPKKKAPQR